MHYRAERNEISMPKVLRYKLYILRGRAELGLAGRKKMRVCLRSKSCDVATRHVVSVSPTANMHGSCSFHGGPAQPAAHYSVKNALQITEIAVLRKNTSKVS